MAGRWLIRFCLIGAGTLCSLLIAELTLRIFFPRCVLEYHYSPKLGTTLLPNSTQSCHTTEYDTTVKVNSFGYRDAERGKKKKEGIIRILIIGDSFIEASQVEFQDMIAQKLEYQLSARLKNQSVEVMSMGISGYGPAQYLWTLEQIGMIFSPDIVVFNVFLGNDFSDSSFALKPIPENASAKLTSVDELELIPPSASNPKSLNRRNPLTQSRVFQLCRKALRGSTIENILSRIGLMRKSSLLNIRSDAAYPMEWGIYLQEPYKPWLEAESIMKKVLEKAERMSRANDFEFLVLTHPELATVQNRWEEAFRNKDIRMKKSKWNFSRPRELIESIALEQGIPLVSLGPEFRKLYLEDGKTVHFELDGHWNEIGHKVAANKLSDSLMNGILAGLATTPS